jgi:hypothetical protein
MMSVVVRITTPLQWVRSAQPEHPWYTRTVDGERVTYSVSRVDRGQRRAHLRFAARISLMYFLFLALLVSPVVVVTLSEGDPAAVLHLLGAFCPALAFPFARVWVCGAFDVAITVEGDRLSYQLRSRFFSRSRQWAREDVTAVRWNGHRSIHVIGRRGELIGRMLIPLLHPSSLATLGRAVRIEFGF